MFLVKNLQASRVNLLMNDFAAGLPSPLAFLGLGAAIAPALGLSRWERRPPATRRWEISVLPVLHRVDAFEGRTKAELSIKEGAFKPIEIPEDLVGSVTVSLLLDIPECTDEHLVAEALLGRRIAGGPINNAEIEVNAVKADGSAFRGVDRGYAMIRTRPPKSEVVATGKIDELVALAAELYIDPGAGWHVPVAVGHRLLEDPAKAPKRANTRDANVPHVFAEPVVGLAELVSVRNKRLTDLDEGGLRQLLWRWTAEGEWIVGHPNYHPGGRVKRRTLMAKGSKAIEKGRLETGMLSFARSLQPSEGLFFGTRSKDDKWCEPVEVREKGVRGQSSEYKTDNPGKSNPQVVETAAVPPGCDGVLLKFTMRVLPHARKPWACDEADVGAAYESLITKYADKGGFNILARLYLWNIANARFAWRNRYQTDHMRVEVAFDQGGRITFDPARLSLEQPSSVDQLRSAALSNEPAPVEELIAWVARGLKEKDEKGKFLSVGWHARMAEGQEVFPSQEYLRDESATKNAPSRVYAKLRCSWRDREVNQASMHSQKIGAALRHIDTWHGHQDYKAIAVNPYGGVQETGAVLRAEKNRNGEDSAKSFYKLRDKPDDLLSNIESATNENDISGNVHFFVANLVRGGVFGQ